MSSYEMDVDRVMEEDENRATPDEKKNFKALLKTIFEDMEKVKHKKFQTKLKLLTELVMEHTDLVSKPRGYLVILSDFHNFLNFLQELTEFAINVYNMKYKSEDENRQQKSKHEISEDKHLLCRNNMYFIYEKLKEFLSRVEATQKQEIVYFCQKELKQFTKILKKKCLGPSYHFPKGISVDYLANWAEKSEQSSAQLIEKEFESKSFSLIISHQAEMAMKNDAILKMENQLKEIQTKAVSVNVNLNNVKKENPKPVGRKSKPMEVELVELKPIVEPEPGKSKPVELMETKPDVKTKPKPEKSKPVELVETKPVVKPKPKPEKSKPIELVETKPVVKPKPKPEKSKPIELVETKPAVVELKPKLEKPPAEPKPEPVKKVKKIYVRKNDVKVRVKAESIKSEDDDSVYLMFDEPSGVENPLFKRFKR